MTGMRTLVSHHILRGEEVIYYMRGDGPLPSGVIPGSSERGIHEDSEVGRGPCVVGDAIAMIVS